MSQCLYYLLSSAVQAAYAPAVSTGGAEDTGASASISVASPVTRPLSATPYLGSSMAAFTPTSGFYNARSSSALSM